MRSVKVEVASFDISMGLRGNCRACPVALAIGRKLGRTVRVFADGVVESYSGWEIKKIGTADGAIEFMKRFDEGQGRFLQPFEFVMQLEEENDHKSVD